MHYLDNLYMHELDREPALQLSLLILLLFYFGTFSGQETCANLQPLHSRCQNAVETEIIRGITHAYTHTRTAGLSVGDQNKKGVVLTHWLSGMLQPQRLTGPYLP